MLGGVSMNRSVAALLVSSSLLIGASAGAESPQGKGHKHGKGPARQAKQAKTEDTGMRFQGLDLNGDRVITRSEWRGSDASFRANDWNRDGVLSGDEVRPHARKPDQFLRGDWRGDLREFDKADTNHDGVL